MSDVGLTVSAKTSEGIDEDERDSTAPLEYSALLREAHDTDLVSLEMSSCVTHGTDERGTPVLLCIPRVAFDSTSTVNESQIRKILLLLVKVADTVVKGRFALVYAHDGAQYWLNRQPIVFKFYKLLPRLYKRNMEKMYIIHPNVGIKMFFEFSRVFLRYVYVVALTSDNLTHRECLRLTRPP